MTPKTIISIEMNNVDHANKFKEALERFFAISDIGGDTELCLASYGHDIKYCGFIGYDVRKPKIIIKYNDDARCPECSQGLFSCICFLSKPIRNY